MNPQLDFLFEPTVAKFHNTIDLHGEELIKRQKKTKAQNWLILEFLRKHSYEDFTPPEVQKAMDLNHVPLTSIRRALSDLTDMGYLVKTDIKRPGVFGELNFCWRIK